MPRYQLIDFLEDFLEHEKLPEFELTFEPFNAHRPRRAKRSTTMIEATAPPDRKLPDNRTAKDLFNRLHQLAPESKTWVEKRYALRMYDDVGARVGADELLGDLRKRSSVREKAAKARVQQTLEKSIQSCEDILAVADVKKILEDIIKQRYRK